LGAALSGSFPIHRPHLSFHPFHGFRIKFFHFPSKGRYSFQMGLLQMESPTCSERYELAMRFTKGKYAGIEKSTEECGAVLR
jgi:hypothetical protein